MLLLSFRSSRVMNVSTSGVLRVNHSSTYARSINASVSRKSFSLAADSKILDKSSVQTPKHTVQVFDENGKDVTPQPLYQPDPAAVMSKHSKIFASDTSGGTMSDFYSTAYQTTTNASFAGPFTRSVFGSSTVSRGSQSTMESMNEEIEDPSSKRDISISLSDVQVRREEVKELIKEEMLDDVVDRYLIESETLWLLHMPAVSVSVDSEEAESVKERNNLYMELCKNRMGNDKYVERSMQTFNGAPKTKEVQSEAITMVDAATTATTWDMYDSFRSAGLGEAALSPDTDKASVPEIVSNHRLDPTRAPERTMSVISTTSIASASSSRIEIEPFVVPSEDEPDPELVLQSEKFQQDLFVMERIILENIYQPKLAAYRQLPTLEDPDSVPKVVPTVVSRREESSLDEESTLTPALERLWSFSCELTSGHNVSSMAWNKRNPDLLAVGYGQFDFKDQKSGLICCWSLKNPTWPERVFTCESGVTTLDFSASNASQLAVGMHDGSIATYNVESREKTPVIDSSDCAHKHTSPVWQVRWIDHERGASGEDKGETLISVSADGRISKWFLRKGLDCIDLMKLKRTRNEKDKKQVGDKEKKSEALISRQAPGLCFDFHPTDSNIYIAGTEEGHIHKCSCSYNEQFLETYIAHKGPLYRITWSPFCSDVFLSCSSDWTIQLWRQDLFTPVLGFTSTQSAVYDVMWSPKWATVFGAVNEGRVEIWDLGASIQHFHHALVPLPSLDPTIVSLASPGVKLTSLLFATETDCILVGDSDGQVSIYQLKNLTVGEGTQVAALEDIIGSTLASQL
ncbi:dynein intermediate chain 4, axonemal isoform X2 [Oncorhynchus mykiss]|uniref:dynein intermediate chain 4, axonemal isoform X2 n=1 Tax=Oncorhynchus mykiss TaxID=8022 RepID=UPI001878F191|nr:dynein intermediate chain 4, axonemal isoform X2 [Oncorhynchus mykiss]